MTHVGRLLFPAIRWDAASGFEPERAAIDAALAHGVGGFCIFGGDAPAVRELVYELHTGSPHPLLIASDLERGAGQQFAGATQLPPLAALGALDDPETTERAAQLTARESLALGVNWVYAPVADLDVEPRNPIVGTRAFGRDADLVARHVDAWVRGCRGEAVLCCAKHFPGHGRTTEDSHAVLPSVPASRATLDEDIAPFRTAVRAGVDAIMTAHVAYPALDPSGVPATLSRTIVTDLLRAELGFDGLVVTDALIMEGVLRGDTGETRAAVQAIAAGCDALLYPRDLATVARELEEEIGASISRARLDEAAARIDAAARRTGRGGREPVGRDGDRAWAIALAARACTIVRGRPRVTNDCDVLTVDDDRGGPWPPPARDVFPATLRSAGLDVREVDRVDGARPLVIALYADIRAWKGRPGLSAQALEAVGRALGTRADATLVLFGHPRLAGTVRAEHVLAAWGGEAVMQSAAALRLHEHGSTTA